MMAFFILTLFKKEALAMIAMLAAIFAPPLTKQF
jgi:hypothetical protein